MLVSRDRAPLFALLAGNAVSLLGNVVAAVGIPWFVLATTGSAARTGVAAFCTTVPLALGAFFGGAVADRVGARRASVAGDLLSGASLAGIPLLYGSGSLEFWHVLALGFLGSLFDAPSQAARQSLLPELAERAALPLERANALHKGAEHVGYVLGAPLAGLLIATAGAANALWIDAASFAAAAVIVAAFVPAGRAAKSERAYLADLRDGLRFIAREPVVRGLLVVPTVGNFFISPLGPVVLPVYAREELGGPSAFAGLMAAYGMGGVVGIALFGLLGERVPRRTQYIAAALLYPALSACLLILPSLWPTLAVLAAIGVTAGAVVPLFQTIRQERTPAALRGRVFAMVSAAEALVVPPAVLLAGVVVETFGLRAALVGFAAGNVLYAGLKLALPATRDLDPPDATVGAGDRLRRHPLARRPFGRRRGAEHRARDRAVS